MKINGKEMKVHEFDVIEHQDEDGVIDLFSDESLPEWLDGLILDNGVEIEFHIKNGIIESFVVEDENAVAVPIGERLEVKAGDGVCYVEGGYLFSMSRAVFDSVFSE